MIYLIVGGSRAGKTTFVENSFLRGHENTEHDDLFTYTENEKYIIFGSYNRDDRRKGTDTTSRRDIKQYFDQIERLIHRGGWQGYCTRRHEIVTEALL